MNEFLHMGGYAAFIWPCYAMALVTMGVMLVMSMRALSKSKRDLAIMESLEAGKPNKSPSQPVGEQA